MIPYRWQLVKIAGDEHGVITVTDFKELSKQLRRLREVTCSEFHFLILTSLQNSILFKCILNSRLIFH